MIQIVQGNTILVKMSAFLDLPFTNVIKNKVWSLCENTRVLYYTVKNDCVTNFAAAIAISVNELAYAVIFFFSTEGYCCTGNLTGWTKCTFITKQPKRDKWEISEELKEESDFL